MLGVIAVLQVILIGNTLMRILGSITRRELPADALWSMLTINVVHNMLALLPLSLYLGIVLGMGRLYRDSEMSAMSACGIGTVRLLRPVLTLTVPVALLTLLLSMFLAPVTASWQDQIRHQAKYASKLSGLVAGQFNSTHGGESSLFFERWEKDGEEMSKVFYYDRGPDSVTIQTAERAHLQPEAHATYVVFENGSTFVGTPGQSDYRIVKYHRNGIRLHRNKTPLLGQRITSTPTLTLMRSSDPELRAEWHWRLGIPIACLLLGMLALPLSYSSPRKGRYGRVGTALLIYIIYLNGLSLGENWIQNQSLPEYMGLWWLHGIALLAVVLLVLKLERKSVFRGRPGLT